MEYTMMASQYIAINALNVLISNLSAAIDGKLEKEASVEAINAAGRALDEHHRCEKDPYWPYAWGDAIRGKYPKERQKDMTRLLEALFDLYSEDQEGLKKLQETARRSPTWRPSDRRWCPVDRHATAPWADDWPDEETPYLPW